MREGRGYCEAWARRRGSPPAGRHAGAIQGDPARSSGQQALLALPLKAQASDLITFLTVPAVLVMAALVAIVIPACRAAKVDPIVALRNE